MVSDATYDLCLPTLEDQALDEEDKTEKLEGIVQTELSITGRPLEDAVLSILWRYRESKVSSVSSPPLRHSVIRRNSPAPWQNPRASTPSASPGLSRASPAPPPGFGVAPSAFMRSKSYGGGSPFTSPRPSPRLAFAHPIPHSPSLTSYEFSEPSLERDEYGDYGSDTVDWLVNEASSSRPSSSGAGSTSESGLNAAAASWIQPQSNEMSPYDMLRSVMGDGKSDEEIESALEANGYDLSATLMNLMGSQGAYQQEQSYFPESDGQILIGKSMTPSQPIMIDQTEQGRSNIVCKYWLSNGSCLRADCRFSHDLSSHICKYWLMGNCLAGDSCIFSHDPALLLNRMNIGDATVGTPPSQLHPSFQVQDYDTFPTLRPAAMNQWAQASSPGQFSSYKCSGPQNANSSHMSTPRRQFEPRTSSMNGMSSSHGSSGSRPTSRHRSREPTPSPSIPPVDDNEAFPTLGAAGNKGAKKHHGKRGGHGHGHSNKENIPNSLADVVRMSPSPAPSLLRKGLMKTGSYTGSRENTLAANCIPAPQHVPWLETGAKANQEYLKARQDAFKHGGLRNKFLQSAAQAWNRNDARAAKALSLRGQSENDLMRKAHREAARLLYEERNKDSSSSQEVYVDLHGLHPEEAVEYLEHALIEHQMSSRPVYAITGTGHHSKYGKDKVGKAIRSFLSEWKYAYREFSVAGDSLGGILGVDPKSFDKSMLAEKKTGAEKVRKEDEIGGKIKIVKNIPTGPRQDGINPLPSLSNIGIHILQKPTSLPTFILFSSNFRRFASPPLRSSFGLTLAAATTFRPSRPPPAHLSPAPLRSSTASGTARNMHSKVVIIGSGPAAHTAAVYLSRAELQPVLYEGMLANGIAAGGQLTTTTDVENYPGFPGGIGGSELMEAMRAQSERFGTKIISETIERVDLSQRPFKLWPEYTDEPVTAEAVIIATGASARRLNLLGEEKYWQNGISACAVCDGAVPIFRQKPLVVIGGGDSAAEEAMFLAKYGSHVTVLVRKDKLRASKTMAKRLLTHPKCSVRFNTVATEVTGEAKDRGLMTGLRLKNVETGEEEHMEANGLFYAVGHDPATNMFKGVIDMDSENYIVTKAGTSYTNIEGVFAAGDVQDKRYRQAITSAGSGCIAALEAEKFLAEQEDVEVTDGIEGENQAKKPTNGEAPEYRSNPLL